MTRIIAKKRHPPDVGLMRHRVIVCTTVEKPDGDVSTIVTRPGVMQVHARVSPIRGEEILNWKAVMGTENSPTHEIWIRCPPDVKVDLNHWVYVIEKHAETWYRVRNVEDIGGAGRFLLLMCSVDTVNDKRSDPATQPVPPRWERPDLDVRDAI